MSPTLPFTEGDNFSSLLLNTIWPEALPMNLGKNKVRKLVAPFSQFPDGSTNDLP
jgi:hypothetical protein